MPHPFDSFYRGKRILVTGHTGFTGGWLVAWLKLLNAKICGYGLPPATRPNLFDATLLDRGITSIFGDVRNGEALTNTFAEFQPEIVFHCSDRALPGRAFREPVETFATNVMGTVNVLEETRLSQSVRAVVLATGDSCYQDRDWFWGYREEDALGGRGPCGASMAGAELAASAYIQSFFRETRTGVATARTANFIGGGDWAEDRLIPCLVRGITAGEPARISHGATTLPCWHVLEAARAYLMLAQRLYESGQTFSGSWNFGPADEDAIPAQTLADNFIKLWGAGEFVLENDGYPRSGLRLNTRKARMLLDWAPALSLKDALGWTVEWYQAFYADSSSAWRTSEDQIMRYAKITGSQPLAPARPGR
jgi:CDP-glucose 4,6-dehydratase